MHRTKQLRNRRMRRWLQHTGRGLRRSLGRALGAAAAAALVAGSGAASAEPIAIGWTPGIGPVSYDASQLEAGVNVDIDGDLVADFMLEGFDLGSGYGGEIQLSPLTVVGINNAVYSSGNFVREFATPDDVLAVLGTGAATIEAPDPAVLWDDFNPFADFEDGGFAGLLFEIPAGSPYIGYLQLEVDGVTGAVTLQESGFQFVPEPGTGMLLLGGLLGVGALQRRRTR